MCCYGIKQAVKPYKWVDRVWFLSRIARHQHRFFYSKKIFRSSDTLLLLQRKLSSDLCHEPFCSQSYNGLLSKMTIGQNQLTAYFPIFGNFPWIWNPYLFNKTLRPSMGQILKNSRHKQIVWFRNVWQCAWCLYMASTVVITTVTHSSVD